MIFIDAPAKDQEFIYKYKSYRSEYFSKKLWQLMDEAQCSIYDLSYLVKTPVGEITLWLSAWKLPTLETVKALMKLFHCSWDDFFPCPNRVLN